MRPLPTFTLRGFRDGIGDSAMLAASSIVYGLIFGALAAQAGIGLFVAGAMSALVYAGGAQVACLQLWAAPLPVVAILATTLAVNARYILLSAALRPWLGRGKGAHVYGSLFTLSDGGWALSIRRWQAGPVDTAYLLGTGLAQYPLWLGATLVGHVLGNSIGAPEAWGLDFFVPAFFAAMAAGIWRRRRDLAPVLVAGLIAFVAVRLIPGHWGMLIGAFAGSLTGAFTHARKP
ncbi:MAG: AzlC family ABC transporter permease [Rhodospirillaceae bacterium]|nr:AzlC family ABC transporter permease [Rhodospirillaceae bacterium]